MKNEINFNEAMKLVSNFYNEHGQELYDDYMVLRDIQGRFRILANVDVVPEHIYVEINKLSENLFFYASKPFLQTKKDMFNPEKIFSPKEFVDYLGNESDKPFKLIDRTITGSGWTHHNYELDKQLLKTPKIAFFGLKGGVGRSTALTILAYKLAKKNKNVVLLDLDLESPGLSSLVLPEDSKPKFGVVDWLLESNFTNDTAQLVDDMVGFSPLSTNTNGSILVFPAMGRDRSSYMDKLSRIYSENKDATFNDKLIQLCEKIAEIHTPDIILIDSRSGLHDIAALSIVGLSDVTFLFGIDSEQSWQGYETLFDFWKSRPEVARNIREKLKIVQSLLPETDQVNKSRLFRQKSYDIFAKYLYDNIEPITDVVNSDFESYSFEENDDVAPHNPIRIMWNNRFQEFSPLLLAEEIVTEQYLDMCFGELIDWVNLSFDSIEES
ncbi:TPA: AAA family ATPase [Enterobacter hormaechei]|nr:AAA family ATPase [Enterobacter hormaechei]HDV8215695.1 AAA family ATPase [Enterobacter hormaechei]